MAYTCLTSGNIRAVAARGRTGTTNAPSGMPDGASVERNG
jgi:hypothetical protein